MISAKFKKVPFILFLLLLSTNSFALDSSIESVEQTLVPKEFFVGDAAQLRYTFDTKLNLFLGIKEDFIHQGTLELKSSPAVFESQKNNYEVKKITLFSSGQNYTLCMEFVPWVTGLLNFPPLDLFSIIPPEAYETTADFSSGTFIIDFDPVAVSSLSQKYGAITLRSPIAPILLPGTNYILWSIIILSTLLFFLIILVLAKFPFIAEALFSFNERIVFLRNARLTKKKIRLLLKKEISDSDFAGEWQGIVRNYLSCRFAIPFDSTATTSIAQKISNVTGALFSDEIENAVLSLVSLFVRTDYIRFASQSIDSRRLPAEEFETSFAGGEKIKIADATIESINALETKSKKEDKV